MGTGATVTWSFMGSGLATILGPGTSLGLNAFMPAGYDNAIRAAFAAWSAVAPYGLSSLNNAGPHGLGEMLYAFTSATANNGSAFAGINANTPWYNTALGLAMLLGRFWMILPALALAGAMAGKKTAPPGPGTLPTNGPIFVVLLMGVIVIVGALTFFPVLSLGPIVEHFLAAAGKVY